jgi:hypothetical protein
MKGVLRPKATILEDSALVPRENRISPAPKRFTHILTRSQPFYFKEAQQGGPPDGEFPLETKLLLLQFEGGRYCRVADERGLNVEIEYDALKKL